ncbi:MAG: tripartite tricarboxylate transporter substrate binding protein BugE [Polaromonas sp.]|uniref:tripartite tricarboxylate transporter substrate binding protein BugE n=1 Tax=Polaromonas sp. TaxID=1869339 RepID=UPI002731A823|nr:tripartite tricarboxylate transporter substrate binding protein BugE [Polaromonas sp.]MDP2449676.1 tripartite tricarboxylate transporter substrate binding protein BugE [Polaromonas sp.]MDP3248778.1 tripartite tricarboxylate transporter substrate binding protein BugE [Polaromonas sp.]
MQRRHLIALAATSVLPGMGWAQSNKPLRLVVPFPPGGATDMTARALAEPLARALGMTVVVENRSGAGGSIGMSEVAKSAPDGLTLGLATLSTHGVNPAVYKKLPYDPVKDFVAVTELVKAPGVVVVNAALPVKNFAELVAYLKANPGKLSYASPGNGTIGHMWGEMFKSSTNTFMVHIPYRGAGPALNDVVGGQVMVYFDQVAASLPFIQSGKLRAIAVSWDKRLDVLPGTPTYGEIGLPNSNDPSWFGLVAPAGTPAAVVNRVQQAVVKSLQEPAVRTKLAAQGLFASGTTPAEFDAQIKREIAKMQRIAQFAKISIE